MRLLLLLVFIITTYSSNAQGSYNYYFDWEIRNLNENQISDNLKGVVREVKATYISKKPKRTFQINKTINADGLVTNVKRVNNEGDVVSNIEADYNAKGNVTKYLNTGKNGKVRVQKFNTHDDQFRLTETKQLNKKGQIDRRNTWTFGEGKCANSSETYAKGGEKIKRHWNYEFYKECDPSKTTLTNAKGKILKTWTYDCKKEGEQLTKKKDETQVCKWEESDGKYLIKIYQNFDEKGKIRKQAQKYSLDDTLILESYSYDENDKIEYKIEYAKSFGRQKSYISYNKKGEERMHREQLYLNSVIQSSVSLYKGKKSRETFYTYNEKGWLTKVESFGKKDEKISSSKYEYVL